MDVLIDVGGVYDAASHRYDHHQREFKEVFGHGFNTKLSSAGLVYLNFGKEIVASTISFTLNHHLDLSSTKTQPSQLLGSIPSRFLCIVLHDY